MNFFSFGIQTLSYGIMEILYGMVSVIPKLTYLLANSFLCLLDVFQLWFRQLAGLDVYYIDGEAQSGDIVYQFMRGIISNEYPVLTSVFWGLIILGVILLIVSTIISIIRNEYTAEKGDNSKGKIVGQSFKALFYFAIIPIVCLFGVYLANVILVAVDKATQVSSNTSTILNESLLEPYVMTYNTGISGGTETTAESYNTYTGYNVFGEPKGSNTTTFSGMIFKASCYSANRVRITENLQIVGNDGNTYNGFFDLLQNDLATNFNGLFKDDGNDADMVALYIDTAFADCVKVKYPQALKYDQEYIRNYNTTELDPYGRNDQGKVHDVINRFNVTLVWYYYDLWQYDVIVLYGAAIIMISVFINIIFGLIKRIIELIGLFLMSAPLIGLFPLDNGDGYKKWRKNFLNKTLMAYGAVGGMNILFLLLPYLREISFFNDYNLDNLAATIITITALMTVKSFIAMTSDFVGGADAHKEGDAISKDIGRTLSKAGTVAVGGAASLAVAGVMAGKVAFKGAKKLGSTIKKQATKKSRLAEKTKNFELQKQSDKQQANKEKIDEIDKINNNRSWYETDAEENMSEEAEAMYGKNSKINPETDEPWGNDDERIYARSRYIEKTAQERMEADKETARKKAATKISQIDERPAPSMNDKDIKLDFSRQNVWSNVKDGGAYSAKTIFGPSVGILHSMVYTPLKSFYPDDNNGFLKGMQEGSLNKKSFAQSIKQGITNYDAKAEEEKKELKNVIKQQELQKAAQQVLIDKLKKSGQAPPASQDDVMQQLVDVLKDLKK